VSHPDVTNLAWAAGVIDGEGCITIGYRKNSGTHQLTIRVVSKDNRMCPKMHDIFGGSLWRDKQERLIWQVTGARAAEVARLVYPYIVVKPEQIDIAIAFGNTIQPASQRLSKGSLREVREPLYQRLKELHQYGTDPL